jgi:hypothetical protein
MINSTDAYKLAVIGDVRRMYIQAIIDLIDPDITFGANTSSGNNAHASFAIHDKVFEQGNRLASCEADRVRLDGTWSVCPDDAASGFKGFMSTILSGADGSISAWVQLNFTNVSVLQACSVYFPGDDVDGVAEDFTVQVFSGATAYYTKTVTGNTKQSVSFDGFTVQNPTAIKVTVTKWSIPGRFVRVCEIVPGIYENWTNHIIAELSINQQIDPSCLSLPYGTATLKMDNQTRRFEPRSKSGLFQSIEERQGIPLSIGCRLSDGTKEYKQVGVYYQYSGGWKTGDNGLTMQWDLVDIIGLLANRTYIAPGTLPTTLSGWAASLVSQLGVNFATRYSVDSAYASKALTCTAASVTGKTCGDILRWICQATQTFPRADAETGYLCIEPLWSAGRNITLDNMGKYPVMKANNDLAKIIVKLTDGTTLNYGGNDTASSQTVSVENPFIANSTQAAALAKNILQFYGGNQLEVTDRGDPSAELGDIDRVQLDESQATSARRISQDLGFSGGVMKDLAATLLQANGLGLYQSSMTITQSGTITLPAKTTIHLILAGSGTSGTAGTDGTWSDAGIDGVDGIGGKVWAQDININSGATAAAVIGTNGGATTLTIGGTTYSSADGQLFNGFSDIFSGNVYGRDGVTLPLSNSGDGGKGGAGGVKGNRHTESSTDSDGNTSSRAVIDNEPGDGKAGAAGASGCAIIYYDKE